LNGMALAALLLGRLVTIRPLLESFAHAEEVHR